MVVGSGIDISKKTASFVLLTDDIGIIPTLVRLGKKYNATIKRNILFFVIGFNALAMLLAVMGILDPFISMTIMIVVFVGTWFLGSTNTFELDDRDVTSKS
jgi:Zn2+/Cd2+-exporting ATPase